MPMMTSPAAGSAERQKQRPGYGVSLEPGPGWWSQGVVGGLRAWLVVTGHGKSSQGVTGGHRVWSGVSGHGRWSQGVAGVLRVWLVVTGHG